MSPAPQPWIVIPAHNRRELTLSCLRHLEALGECARHTVLVVDDGSTDGTADAVRYGFPSVRVLQGDGQLWWTGAIALGMRAAFAEGATAVCWLNDDCHPAAGTLAALAAFGAQHPRTLTAPVCVDDVRGAPVANAFIGRTALATSAQAEQPVDGLSGFCVWIPRQVWEIAGVPDAARFPHYYGDNAYALRVRRRGGNAVLLTQPRAHLVAYQARPLSVSELVRRQTSPAKRSWGAVFAVTGSPFRLKTQFHYLVLRYGFFAGTLLWLLRAARWQSQWLIAR